MNTTKKRKITGLAVVIATVFFGFIFHPMVAFAEDTAGIADFLQSHSEWLQFGTFLTVITHTIGWWVIKGLYFFTNLFEGLTMKSLDLFGFLESAGLNSVASAIITDLVTALMVLTLTYLGFKVVIAKEPPKFKNIAFNIILSGSLIVGLPSLMNTMQEMSLEFYESTQTGSTGEVASLSWNLIKDNTADISYVSSAGFDVIKNDSEKNAKNNLEPDVFKAIDMSEVLTKDKIKDYAKNNDQAENLNYTLSADQGELTATKIDSSWLSVFSDSFKSGYFKYPVKFTPVIVGLIALCVAYLFTIFVFITTIIEIGFKRIIGLFVFATDLENGQRTKMVLQDISSSFLLIAFTGISLNLYTLLLSYLATSDINAFIYIIAIVSGTFILIKGSNTIMRYFGVDVGLKDGFAQMAGAMALGSSLSNLAKKPFSKKGNGKDTKDSISDQDEASQQSINDQGDGNGGSGGKLRNSVNSAGKKLGYLNERGVMGMAEDAVKGTGEKIAEKAGKVADGAKGIKTGFKDGLSEGNESAKNNQAKWESKKKSSDDSSESKEKADSPSKSINKSEQKDNPQGDSSQSDINSHDNQRTGTETQSADPNISNKNGETMKGSSADGKSGKSNEEILTEIKMKEATMPNQKVEDVNGNINLQQTSEKAMNTVNDQDRKQGSSLNDGQTERQTTLQDVQSGTKNTINDDKQMIDQEVNTGLGSTSNGGKQIVSQEIQGASPQAVQKVLQQVDKVTFGNPESIKQNIVQEVQKGSFGSSEEKQRIVQEIEKSSQATPQQLKQNIEQVFETARVPEGISTSVQKVIQDIEPGSQHSSAIKQKVIQEIEQADFGTKEPLKQMIVQQVEKAFSATPEQMQQNIKETIETVETKTSTQTTKNNSTEAVKQESHTNSNTQPQTSSNKKKTGFGTLFGDDINDLFEETSPNKKSRFDFIKNT